MRIFRPRRYRGPMAVWHRPTPLWQRALRFSFEVIGVVGLMAGLLLLMAAAPHIDAWVIGHRPW